MPVLSFLLPAMLMWTSPSSSHHQEWVKVMVDSSCGCVRALAMYVQSKAGVAAAGLGNAQAQGVNGSGMEVGTGASSSRGVGSEGAVREAEAQLGTACQVLYQLLSSVPAVLSAAAAGGNKQAAGAKQGRAWSVRGAGDREALVSMLQGLCCWSACRKAMLAEQQQQHQLGKWESAAVAAAETMLAAVHSSGLQLSALLPAAAVAGLVLLAVQEVPDGTAAAAAAGSPAAALDLLCWGCQVGWCVQVVAAEQQLSASGVGAAVGQGMRVSRVLECALEDWDIDEVEAAWESCLVAAAELLTQPGVGSVLGLVLSGAEGRDGWLGQARQGWRESGTEQVPETRQLAAAAAAVVEGSMGMQLLLQASAAIM